MAVAETVRELRKSSPTTLSEIIYTAIIFLIGVVILLRPNSILWISGINPAGILDQPGWVGLTALGGSPSPLLMTKFSRWALAGNSPSEDAENANSKENENQSSTESEDIEEPSANEERSAAKAKQ